MLPERQLVRERGLPGGRLLEAWSAPGWPDPETEQVYAGHADTFGGALGA
jgi:hypothetical protein